MSDKHLDTELANSEEEVIAQTQFGPIRGRRAANAAAVFLEIPFALSPRRFEDPKPLPPDYRYEDKEYIHESRYATQPTNDGQAAGGMFEDKVGHGTPSESPLFVNIVAPPSYPTLQKAPVRVYIHGGFLQFGSPHGLSSQAQYVAAERSEVWVNIGYRLSAFGFLACDVPEVKGNFGFKDQWLGLEWVKQNISAFGGDPDDIQLFGLSAGAHSVHQILHYVSRLPPGTPAPFNSAVLQSNSIATAPKSPTELRPQFQALCHGLGLNPDADDILDILRDVPWQAITNLIDSEKLGSFGTFRGCSDGAWMATDPDPMTWQRTGGLARGLAAHGVRSVLVGDLSEEWYLYAIAHDITRKADVAMNLQRYYPDDITAKMMDFYAERMPDEASPEELQRVFGDMLSEGQVHLPVRLLHRDLANAGFPVLRYEIRWTPEQVRQKGADGH